MDHPIVLNEEISQKPQKFASISSVRAQGDAFSLDQPILETIKRDVKVVYDKIKITLSGQGDYEKLRRQWDLWGPLLISLITASLCAMSTSGNSEQAFTNVFLGLWIGPLIITINSRLLGAKVSILQSLCFIIYCSAPVMMLSFLVFLMNFVIGSFLINLILAGCALVFTLKSNQNYFRSLITGDRQLLNLYPVLLFYVFICLFIAMI